MTPWMQPQVQDHCDFSLREATCGCLTPWVRLSLPNHPSLAFESQQSLCCCTHRPTQPPGWFFPCFGLFGEASISSLGDYICLKYVVVCTQSENRTLNHRTAARIELLYKIILWKGFCGHARECFNLLAQSINWTNHISENHYTNERARQTSGVNLVWNPWIRVKTFLFSRKILEKFWFFEGTWQTKNRFIRANFRKFRFFTGTFTKIFNFSRQILEKFRFFRQFKKKI